MSVDFSRIKKYSKTSNNFDEKLEYLNKELKKTGLCEIANATGGMYSVTKQEPNSSHNAFKALSHDGQSIGFSGANYNIFTEPIGGLKYSPPHPVTGQRLVAQSYYGIASDFRPVPAGSDRQIMWVFDQDLSGGAGRYFSLELSRGDSPYWGMWIDTAFGTSILVPFDDDNSPLSSSMKTDLGNLNINNFTDPEDFGPPTNPILFQNNLDDPSFLPINIDGISPEAFNWLKERAREFAKKYGRKYQGANDPFWDDFINSFPDIPAGDEDPFTRKGTGMDDRWIGPPVDKVDAGTNDKTEIAMPPAAILAAMAALGIAIKGAESAWKMYRKYKQQIDQKIKEMKAEQGQTASYEPEGDLLSEAVKLGHFEPEVLNVDINDIRKGIMPEFPKDPPPEMIGGYSAKSRLVRKDPKLPPYIKVTRKDLAKNHKLTDKEIQDFLDDVKRINEYIKKNPAELIYAMTRYPKNDPRLAQLNFKMDEMKRASDQYVETHFPENEKLFNKLQDKIIKNIEQTDPKNFTGHAEAPKFTDNNLEMSEQKKKIIMKHFKKPVKIKKLFKH